MRYVTLILVGIALGRISEFIAALLGVGKVGEIILIILLAILYNLAVSGTTM